MPIEGATAIGVQSIAGSRAFSLVGKDDRFCIYKLKTVNGISVGMAYSAFYKIEDLTLSNEYAYGNRDLWGKVLSVNTSENYISVDRIWEGTV